MIDLIIIFLIIFLIIYIFRAFLLEGGFPVLFCELGFHQYKIWKYVYPDYCLKIKACSVCGKFSDDSFSKIDHIWKMTYIKTDLCEKQEKCQHCGELRGEIIIGHDFVDSFQGENTNSMKRQCARCGFTLPLQIPQSEWPWVFDNGDKRLFYISFQKSILQTLNSSDIFLVINNSRDQQVIKHETKLPKSNFSIYGFVISNFSYGFFPDGIHVFTKNPSRLNIHESIWHYEEIICEYKTISVHQKYVPDDAKIIRQTWLHSRIDGGPDRRYSFNPTIFFLQYAEITFSTHMGILFSVAISNLALAKNFCSEYNNYVTAFLGNKSPKFDFKNSKKSENNNYGGSESSFHEDRKQGTHSDNILVSHYYKLLDIHSDSSKEEIRKAYIKKAQQYHPDKVNNLSKEFRDLAEEKMKELNEAYDFLRK